MLKRLGGRTVVDALEIQHMRALLAAQTAQVDARPRGVVARLSRLLSPSAAPWKAADFATGETPPEASLAMQEEPPLLLAADPIETRRPAAPLVPPQILLGDLAPRRAAFGQRAEPVLELHDQAPTAAQRLTLISPDGAAVGEIILNAGDMTSAILSRRSLNVEAVETPFFPEDLEDEAPQVHPVSRAAKSKTPVQTPDPAPDLAATFLLATLAARLASEEAALSQRLADARRRPTAA